MISEGVDVKHNILYVSMRTPAETLELLTLLQIAAPFSEL